MPLIAYALDSMPRKTQGIGQSDHLNRQGTSTALLDGKHSRLDNTPGLILALGVWMCGCTKVDFVNKEAWKDFPRPWSNYRVEGEERRGMGRRGKRGRRGGQRKNVDLPSPRSLSNAHNCLDYAGLKPGASTSIWISVTWVVGDQVLDSSVSPKCTLATHFPVALEAFYPN